MLRKIGILFVAILGTLTAFGQQADSLAVPVDSVAVDSIATFNPDAVPDSLVVTDSTTIQPVEAPAEAPTE